MSVNVSIALCTYNGERFIKEQLDSILAQTYPIYEIVIQDDHSSDGTWTILEDYKKRFPNLIKIYQNQHNLYWNQNFYLAIQKCSGDMIALCDQDDVWDCRKIEKQVSQLATSNSTISICSHYIWENDVLTPMIINKASLLHAFFFPQFFGHLFLFKSSLIPFLRKGIEVDMAHDIYLGIVGTYYNSIAYYEECLVSWRRHNDASTKMHYLERIPALKKVLIATKCLFWGKKSEVISVATNKYLKVYEWLEGDSDSLDKLIILMRLLSKQSFYSYLKASFLFSSMSYDIVTPQKSWIKTFYCKMTFLFKWWYDHQTTL